MEEALLSNVRAFHQLTGEWGLGSVAVNSSPMVANRKSTSDFIGVFLDQFFSSF